MVAFVVNSFILFSVSSRGLANKRKLFSFSRIVWWAARERKAGSVAHLHRPDDGMYHLKVINLKISRERRQKEKEEEICISFIWIQINRARSGHPWRKEKRILKIGTSFKWRWRKISLFWIVTVISCPQKRNRRRHKERRLKFIVYEFNRSRTILSIYLPKAWAGEKDEIELEWNYRVKLHKFTLYLIYR